MLLGLVVMAHTDQEDAEIAVTDREPTTYSGSSGKSLTNVSSIFNPCR